MDEPATSARRPRTESFTPTVERLIAGAFDEGPGYSTYRSRGTTDWLLLHTTGGEADGGPPEATYV